MTVYDVNSEKKAEKIGAAAGQPRRQDAEEDHARSTSDLYAWPVPLFFFGYSLPLLFTLSIESMARLLW